MTRFLLAVSALALAATPVLAGDQIRVTGSGTVYPFTASVAEAFGKATGKKTPVVEATGSGPGIKLFCSGAGDDTPDFVDSSRAIKKDELATCIKNGVKDVAQLTIGYDGIALAGAKAGTDLSVTKQQLFMAMAKQVPDKDGKLIDNPYKMWSDIDPSLPKTKITILSHPATSGTRSSIEDLVLKPGAQSIASLKELEGKDAKAFEGVFKTLRTDGGFVEAGENDNAIIQKLEADPTVLALFGYSNVALNGSKIKAAKVEGEAPSVEAVQNGKYKLSRPLFVYVKKDHMAATPDMAAFIAEYMSAKAIGDEGYLADKGLIPLPADVLKKEMDNAKTLTALKVEDLK
ncbi:substrate-binding domain-containing protein [Aestuariivirga litoralis]|uniref:substrate-binding domain-containing protein n=1 Tax=Aestuariivirga litoralis TaxID=2650924 RepID=UPI0018C60DFE|nr:substrate-binding domain-containing protein [Aestuariivirga litoralis]MBG1233746.1 phosphate ABC transporter substrate-binding protein [Aestuariivirga litoralis]